jgi:D-alanyl-D-alanine dipeptidase
MGSRIYYTKPSITELEIRYACIAAKGNTLLNYAGFQPENDAVGF